jgi:hypothetical protein
MMLAPWLVVAAVCVVLLLYFRKSAEERAAVVMIGAILLDLLYVPASQHAIEWLNRDTTLQNRADLSAPTVSANSTALT